MKRFLIYILLDLGLCSYNVGVVTNISRAILAQCNLYSYFIPMVVFFKIEPYVSHFFWTFIIEGHVITMTLFKVCRFL